MSAKTKERPILFSTPMVRAILEGRKTQTRRVCKGAEAEALSEIVGPYEDETGAGWCGDAEGDVKFACPYGQPGDHLWVREAWRVPISLDGLSGKQIAAKCLDAGYRTPWCPIQYEADGARTRERNWRDFGPTLGRKRHACFMPRWASRTTLEVTGVRVERLQAISEADAIAEGIEWYEDATRPDRDSGWQCYPSPEPGCIGLSTKDSIYAFRTLWETINGAGSWDANPWVWAIEFEQVES